MATTTLVIVGLVALYYVINQTITQTIESVTSSINPFSLIQSLLSSLVGAAVGAYYGHRFAIRRDKKKDMEIQSGILEAFKREINTALGKLEPKAIAKITGLYVRKGELVSTAIYDFMGGAGFMRLCDPEEITALCNAYSAIRNYNYEAVRARDLAIEHDSEIDPASREQIRIVMAASADERKRLADSCQKTLVGIQEKFRLA
jgi:hypothetical protein